MVKVSELEEGTTKWYGLRSRKTGEWVRVRRERNPKDRYACCEDSYYAYLPRYKSSFTVLESEVAWLLPSPDAILECITKETKYYNADSHDDPVIEFDMEDDDLEIVEVLRTISLKAVERG